MAEILPFPKKSKEIEPDHPQVVAGNDAERVSSPSQATENCPTCQKSAVDKYRPFCSSRCWQVDLGRWLNGSYRVETEERPLEAQPSSEEDERW